MTDIEQAIEKELGFRIRTTPEGDFADYSFGGTSPTVSEAVKLWQSLLSARRENQALARGILKQADELKYIDGIVVKGTGKPMQPDDTYRDRILNYVKSLESRPKPIINWAEIRADFEQWYVLAIADEICDEVRHSTEKIRELIDAQLKAISDSRPESELVLPSDEEIEKELCSYSAEVTLSDYGAGRFFSPDAIGEFINWLRERLTQ